LPNFSVIFYPRFKKKLQATFLIVKVSRLETSFLARYIAQRLEKANKWFFEEGIKGRMEERIDLNGGHFHDKVILCFDCGKQFIFTAGEQAYFQSKSLSIPKRCKPCRELRRRTLVPDTEVRL